jgi:hypothetical protein
MQTLWSLVSDAGVVAMFYTEREALAVLDLIENTAADAEFLQVVRNIVED